MSGQRHAAALAADHGVPLVLANGRECDLDDYHYGYRRYTVSLAPDGRLVLSVRERLYRNDMGTRAVPPPPRHRFANEREIRRVLKAEGITLPNVFIPPHKHPRGRRPPPYIQHILALPYSRWSRSERRTVVQWFFS